MKQNFTNIIFLLFFLGLSNLTFAQKFLDIAVTGSGTTISAEATPGSFGPLTIENYFQFETVSADLKIIDDGTANPTWGCSPATNSLTGNIAIIDRNVCTFVDKCRNAQNAGAIVAIVCNNEPGAPFVMGGDGGEDITIPCMMISQEDCALIRVLIADGAQASISNRKPQFDNNETVFWGDMPGEGDFAGGLNDWTTVGVSSDTAIWKWTELGAGEGELIGNSLTFSIVSPSGDNGAAIFDSDFLHRNILDQTPPYPTNIGELISPTIDCSECQSTKISFYQYNVPLNGTTAVSFSADDGMTWSEPELVTTENVFTADETIIAGTEKREVNISKEFNTAQFKMKFIFDGDFYFWMVDDVRIVEREANNLRVNSNFFATAPNVKVPRSQIDAIHFLADIQNVGAATQENTVLNMTVTNDATGEVVYNEDLAYGTITSDSIAENQSFESAFTPSDVVANYTGVYTVSSTTGEDFDPSDNTRTINFSVTENEFANEDGTNFGNVQIIDPTETPTWSIGNYFYLPKGNGYKVSGFGIGIGNAQEVGGLDFDVAMFKWVDSGEPGTEGFGSVDPSERELVAFSNYEILGNELFDEVKIIEAKDITDADGDEVPILLEDNAHYLVMMTMDSEIGVSAKSDLQTSYSAMNFASTAANAPRYWSFSGDGSDIFTTVYDPGVFTPLVRMYIVPDSVSAVVELSADNLVTVGPNPAKEFVNIGMEFAKSFDAVNVMVTDATGRVVLMNDLKNIQNHQMRIDVSNLAAGIFLVNISTPEGVRTEKFIKVD